MKPKNNIDWIFFILFCSLFFLVPNSLADNSPFGGTSPTNKNPGSTKNLIDPFEGLLPEKAGSDQKKKEGVIILDAAGAKRARCKLAGGRGDSAIVDMLAKGSRASWDISVEQPGKYVIALNYSGPEGRSGPIKFSCGDSSFIWSSVASSIDHRDPWSQYRVGNVGEIDLPQGKSVFSVETVEGGKCINVKSICLFPYPDDEEVNYMSRLSSEKTDPSTAEQSKQGPLGNEMVVKPGENDIVSLRPSQGLLNGPEIKTINGEETVVYVGKGASEVLWNVDVPERRDYVVELFYGAPDYSIGSVFDLEAGNKIYRAKIEAGRGFLAFLTRQFATVSLPKGQSEIAIRTNRQNLFDLRGIRLIPVDLMDSLKKRSRLGMPLEQLKIIWGEGAHVNVPVTFDQKGSKGDSDREIYTAIKGECSAYEWTFPEQADLSITAVMLAGKCVGLTLSKQGGFVMKELQDYARVLVPVASFRNWPDRDKQFTVYSTDASKAFKFQEWNGSFDFKSSYLIRQIVAKVRAQSKEGFGRLQQGGRKATEPKPEKKEPKTTIKDIL